MSESNLEKIMARDFAAHPITIRLLDESGDEVRGSGYAPLTVKGWVSESGLGVEYPTVTFEFDGPLRERVKGYEAECEDLIIQSRDFDDLIEIKGPGDSISIKFRTESEAE